MQEEGKSPGTQSRFGRQKKAVKKDLPAEKSPANKKISKVQQNRDANEKRGTPPPPSRCQRIPKELVPDAIAVWEFLQVVHHLVHPEIQSEKEAISCLSSSADSNIQ